MAGKAQEDEFDQVDKPGAERSRRRRTENDDWESDLEDDLLSDDWGLSKKNQSDLSDEELDDNLLQSDEEPNESYEGEYVEFNASASLELSKSIDKGTEELFEYAEQDPYDQNTALEDVEDAPGGEELEGYSQDDYTEEGVQYEGDEAVEDQVDYTGEQGEDEMYNDEVLDLEINDPLDDEFQEEEYTYSTSQDAAEQLQPEVNEEYEHENIAMDSQEPVPELVNEPIEVVNQICEAKTETKEVSDDEDEDDEESGRIRFKTERKEGTVIRLTDAARKRRNIPDTLELSDEAKAALREFEEMERQRKQGRRGRRGGGPGNFGFCDPRKDGGGRRRDQRPPLMQMPLSLQNPHPMMNFSDYTPGRGSFQQQQQRRQPPPLMGNPRQPPPSQFPIRPQQGQQQQQQQHHPPQQHPPPQQQQHHQQHQQQNSETSTLNQTGPPTQQSKNIHINPHFRGPVVSPVQVPLMPTPSQPRPAVGPQRFLSPPEFQPPIPVPGNFNQPPRLPLQEPWRGPHPQDREPFFMGEPRFQGQHMFQQRSPPPPLMNNHPMPLQPPMVYNHPGPGFNQQQQHLFPREAPVRTSLQPQGPMGMPPFNQPGPLNPRPFIPPRHQFPQGPGQPFPPSALLQPNMQPPMPMQPPPPHNHCSPQPIIPNAPQQFRPHLQMPLITVNDNRLQHPQRQSGMKLRHIFQSFEFSLSHLLNYTLPNVPGQQNLNKLPNQFQASQRNSNLRELPVAPHNAGVRQHRPMSAPPAQPLSTSWAKPITPTQAAPRMKQMGQTAQIAPSVNAPQKPPQPKYTKQKSQDPVAAELSDEDEETRIYRLKIEEQKRLREEILRQKELRRQQQAGARKKELLERLAQQQQQQQQRQQQQQQQQQQCSVQPPLQHHPANAPQIFQNCNPSTPQAASPAQPSIKTRLFSKKLGVGVGLQLQPNKIQEVGNILHLQTEMRKNIVNQIKQIRPSPPNQSQGPAQSKPVGTPGPSVLPGKMGVSTVNQLELKPGVKRTVMQRMNSGGGGGGGDGPHINPKIRVLKLPVMQESENTVFSHPEPQPQRQQQQQQQQLKQQPVRKVTLVKGARLQQQQQQQQQQQRQHPVPQLLGMMKNSVNQQQNRVIMQGRGIALPGQMGRGRMMQHKQNLRVVECRPQPCVVSIEGLSSSTTDFQLKNLLMSVGPIQDFKMIREQRKAIAKFKEPAHASAFQQKFHRHMIDLSHINVALIMDE
ncbi:RNA-binding protein 33 [Callorhinchus milii]|uniref:RNA-binding protein 33 n=1 Tax=Callorhinchus milii TaxID=7868 RepID=UPI001C3FB763|nr:RNA-binding protein 33 [Callorhinchus milii]